MDITPLIQLSPLLLGLGSAAGGIRFIQESQRGVKLRFGKVIRDKAGEPRIYEPGFVFALPTVHSLKRIHVRTQTLTLSPQRVMLADRTVFNVGALVISHVIDDTDAIYRSLFEVDDVATSVEEYCASVVRDVLAASHYHDLGHPESLASKVREQVTERLQQWGIAVEDVKLTDCSPTVETSRMILIQTEAELRAEALRAIAAHEVTFPKWLSPTLAAALVGTPVSVALGAGETNEPSHAEANHSKPKWSIKIGSGHPDAEDEAR